MSDPISGNRGCSRESLVRQFWRYTDKGRAGECWGWKGALDRHGYGHVRVRTYMRSVHWLAHRLSYVVHHEVIPRGKLVLHSCHNPRCVNPSHLRAGTSSDNEFDKVKNGTHREASKTHCKRGHQFDSRNTRISKHGYRVCRACERLRKSPGFRNSSQEVAR